MFRIPRLVLSPAFKQRKKQIKHTLHMPDPGMIKVQKLFLLLSIATGGGNYAMILLVVD